MTAIVTRLQEEVKRFLEIYSNQKGIEQQPFPPIQVQIPPADMPGHFTLVLFPLLPKLKAKPDELGKDLANHLMHVGLPIDTWEVVKGFLNLRLTTLFWMEQLDAMWQDSTVSKAPAQEGPTVIMEFPSPNTNKPLHLGHLRNIFLGTSLARILEASGYRVVHTNLYNDRGTNISKSMAAWLNSSDRLTPESSGMKGDHLVGHYYVQFAEALKQQISEAKAAGLDEDQASKMVPLAKQVEELTLAWEANDADVRQVWETMNSWFYQGAEQTFARLGVYFDRVYKESEVYDLGRQTVSRGLEMGVFYEKPDGSVWINLEDIGLDHKLVLRSNGTTVYMTQDLALAYQKLADFGQASFFDEVGNEQDYHFKVLFEILRRLGLAQPEGLYHLSYGMVELPSGKMKSREGTVVDADDLLEELKEMARAKADEQGRLNHLPRTEQERVWESIGQSALRYFMLRVDPKKRMVFNPEESIDFQGDTGPFIQYIHARCASLLRNAEGMQFHPAAVKTLDYVPDEMELNIIRKMQEFPTAIHQAAKEYSPSIIAHFVYELASAYSAFYHGHPVLAESQQNARQFRLSLTRAVQLHLNRALHLLGMEAVQQM
ncbi:MAG: arginine--tRNA ligase [Bacteroidetes bacterium]|nr:arginine--tRNA ligase [Bacteroidota bacterium]